MKRQNPKRFSEYHFEFDGESKHVADLVNREILWPRIYREKENSFVAGPKERESERAAGRVVGCPSKNKVTERSARERKKEGKKRENSTHAISCALRYKRQLAENSRRATIRPSSARRINNGEKKRSNKQEEEDAFIERVLRKLLALRSRFHAKGKKKKPARLLAFSLCTAVPFSPFHMAGQ